MCTGLNLSLQVCSEIRVEFTMLLEWVGSMDFSQGYAEGEGCLCTGQLAQVKMLKEIFTDSVKQEYLSD